MVDFVGYKTSTQSATVAATSADASATVLYTCPAKHSASVDMLFLSNNNAGAKKSQYNTMTQKVLPIII